MQRGDAMVASDAMSVRPYESTGPSIHPIICILARGPFALCQAILIPIYHLFLAALSFLSARSSSAHPPFLNPSTPIGFFRGLSFECLPSFLYPSPSHTFSCEFFISLRSFFPLALSVLRVRICFLAPFRPVQRTFLFLAISRKGTRERKAHV